MVDSAWNVSSSTRQVLVNDTGMNSHFICKYGWHISCTIFKDVIAKKYIKAHAQQYLIF